MLLLSIFPCEIDELSIVQKQEQRISASHNNQDHPLQNDMCTPFCSCSHCPASAISQSIVPFLIIDFTPNGLKTESLHDDVLISFNSSSIWQPPQC